MDFNTWIWKSLELQFSFFFYIYTDYSTFMYLTMISTAEALTDHNCSYISHAYYWFFILFYLFILFKY